MLRTGRKLTIAVIMTGSLVACTPTATLGANPPVIPAATEGHHFVTPHSVGSSAPMTTTTGAATGVCVTGGKVARACTPGVTNPNVTQDNIHSTICVSGWTKTIRPPTAFTNTLKSSQMASWHLPGVPRDFEEDHLIALEIGGAPQDAHNLWPQSWTAHPDAHDKDAEENTLHREVCSGQLTLAAAQAKILADWT